MLVSKYRATYVRHHQLKEVAFFMEKNIFIPITKVDDDQHMVYGYASTPDIDSDGEIITLDAIKDALPSYLQYPTLREMHQAKAVGTVKHTDLQEKGLFIGAKVVTDEAWRLVKEGVYRGFSIGGNVLNRVGNIINGLELVEISLVDVPANKKAYIELWKKDKANTDFVLLSSLEKLSFDNKVAELLRKAVITQMLQKDQEPVKTAEQTIVEEAVVEETKPEDVVEEVVEAVEEPVKEEATEEVAETEEVEATEEVVEEQKSESEPTLTKMDLTKAVNTLTDLVKTVSDKVAELDEKIEKLGKTAVPAKSQASFIVNKGEETVTAKVEESPMLKAKKERLEELTKMLGTMSPNEFAKQGYSLEAMTLQNEINELGR